MAAEINFAYNCVCFICCCHYEAGEAAEKQQAGHCSVEFYLVCADGVYLCADRRAECGQGSKGTRTGG